MESDGGVRWWRRAMLGRCDDGGEARGAMVVRTAEEERLDSMKNPRDGEKRECEEDRGREEDEGGCGREEMGAEGGGGVGIIEVLVEVAKR